MKKIFTLAFVAAMFSATAQKKIEVREDNASLNGGSRSALTVKIYVKNQDRIERAIKNKMKDFDGKTKSGKEIFGDNCKWKAFGPNTFDMYAKIEKDGDDGFKLIVGVDMGGAWMNSGEHKEQTRLFKNMLQELAVNISKEEVTDDLKEKQKIQANLEDDQKDLEKDNANLKNDIEEYKKKIQKAEEDIKKNEEDQKKKKEEIEKAKGEVKATEEKLKKIE